VCCSVVRCCSVLQCVVVCCSVLQCVCFAPLFTAAGLLCVAVCCSVAARSVLLQCVAVCCSVCVMQFTSRPLFFWKKIMYALIAINAYFRLYALISRLLKIIGLFCRISSVLLGSFAKETCVFKEPTNCSHPITYTPAATAKATYERL